MHELWPACGGRTSVGTTSARLPSVKSIADDAREWEQAYAVAIEARRVAQPA